MRGRWRLTRARPDAVLPLAVAELSYRLASQAATRPLPLAELIGAERARSMHRHGVPAHDIGRVLGRDLAEILDALRDGLAPEAEGFASVWVAGGLLEIEELADNLRAQQPELPISVPAHPLFAGEAGGRRLLAEHGFVGGIVADVGAAGVKVSALVEPPVRRRVERDLRRVPAHADTIALDEVADRAAEMVANAIADVAAACPECPPALVLALPCAIDDDLVPSACSYPGWEGEAELVEVILNTLDDRLDELVGDGEHPWQEVAQPTALVVEDVELAAVGAAASGLLEPILALTLGERPKAAIVGG